MTLSQGQSQSKWYKMLEVNGVYKHGRYAQIWLKSLRVTSTNKVSATQDGPPAELITQIHILLIWIKKEVAKVFST